jgi:Putative adhesin
MGVTMQRTAFRYVLGAALVFAAAAPRAEGQRRDRDREEYAAEIDTTIAFSRTGTVELQLSGGEIIVTSWPREQVRVRATSERSALRLDASSGHVSLGLRQGSSRSGDTRFEVTIPVGARVRATSTSGDIRVSGSKADVEARTHRGDIAVEDVGRIDLNALSGDVEATTIAGDVRINVVSGDVRLRGATGEIEIKTVSGEIDVSDARARFVRLGSTSGDLAYDGSIDATGRYELETHSGDVDLTLPSNIKADLTVSTFSGEVVSDLPLVLVPGPHGNASSHGKSLRLAIGGGGGARINTESFSGDINIRNRGGSPRRDDSGREEDR